jgi:hypothetical protein
MKVQNVLTTLMLILFSAAVVRGETPPASRPTSHSSDLPAPLTLPRASRPAWLAEEGIVMAGDWEPFLFRLRRDNFQRQPAADRGYAYTAEQLAAYRKEHSPQMLQELKALGVNFIMTHCYKGGGFQAERPSMEDAKKLSALAHRDGMHVGVYVSSGTNMIELIRKEHPESAEWELLDANGRPLTYGSATYRHFFDRNHPAWQAHLRPIIRYAVEEIKTDLLHFDNYIHGPGFDRNSMERFCEYLHAKYQPADFGLADFSGVQPPKQPADNPKLYRAWADFAAYSTAKSLYDMAVYARSLRPHILMELNAGLDGRAGSPIDLGRILRYSEACWNEVRAPGVARDGRLQTHIPAYKAAQAMDNTVFTYVTCPLEAAESLAYNTDCLGCIAWFEWGKIVNRPGSKQPIAADVLPYVRFFHQQRPYYRGARRIADIATLRSFASHVFAKGAYACSAAIEQKCIEAKVPWAAVYDHQLEHLDRFPCLSIVGAEALSASQVTLIGDYVKQGGGLIYSERSGMYDEDMRPRDGNPFQAMKGKRVVNVAPDLSAAELARAISQACGRAPSLHVTAPRHVTAELCEQTHPKRRLVHLVNYRPDSPATDVKLSVSVPQGWKVRQVELLSPESPKARSLPVERTGNQVNATVPKLEVYALLSVEAE